MTLLLLRLLLLILLLLLLLLLRACMKLLGSLQPIPVLLRSLA